MKKISPMLIRHIPFFVAVVEAEALTKAAKTLSMTQPALSRRIQDFEETLGVRLFERQNGRLRLTPVGKMFAKDARRILAETQEAFDRIQNFENGQGDVLRLAFNEAALSFSPLCDALRQFSEEHGSLEPSLLLLPSSQQIAKLRSGNIDVGFLYAGDDQLGQISTFDVLNEHSNIVVLPISHPLSLKKMVEIRDMEGEDLILPSREQVPVIHDQMISAWRRAGISACVRVEVGTTEAAINAVKAGFGLAILQSLTLEHPGVAIRPIRDLKAAVPLRLGYVKEMKSAARDRFINKLQNIGLISAT